MTPVVLFVSLRVFKKTSGNGGLTLYLGKRDYVDHVNSVDRVDGVVKLNPADFKDRKVFVQLACAFRYGSDDLDVMGLCFRKDIWIQIVQIYPATDKPTLTAMHDTLLKKAGDDAVPFSFEIPNNLPCSVSLQPGPDDNGKACGVDFEVKTYLAMEKSNPDEKIEKKDTARLIIRKVQFAPTQVGAGPKTELCKSFMMSDKPVYLEASMEKDLYFHGEEIPIKIKVNNESNKTVKKIRILVEQTTDIVLYSADKYTKAVLSQEFGETVDPSGTFEKTLTIIPLLAENKEKRGLSLDGRLKDEDTNLASSTMLRDRVENDVLGILVSYKIKINLMIAGGGLLGGLTSSDVTAELPLLLMHPQPQGDADFEWEPPTEAELKVIHARRERQDKISKLMGAYLLKGYRMLGECCDVCGTILLQDRQQKHYCVSCQELDSDVDKDNPALNAQAALSQVRERQLAAQAPALSQEPEPNEGASSSQASVSVAQPRPEHCEGAAAGGRASLLPPAISALQPVLQEAEEAVLTKLRWATNQLQSSVSLEASIQLCGLIASCANSLRSLKELSQ
ncbi:putative arrestin-C-like [Scophthalmus maximus]|uniref:Arrestin-C n=1 Tax=Scophthalmus maximus TaxID=52904 RepID=A0A2U9B7T2_SCOMX|nr:putative arrestin-C-like [Scophthalmus maximus]